MGFENKKASHFIYVVRLDHCSLFISQDLHLDRNNDFYSSILPLMMGFNMIN